MDSKTIILTIVALYATWGLYLIFKLRKAIIDTAKIED